MDRGRPGAQDKYQTPAATGHFARLKPVVMDLSAFQAHGPRLTDAV
jgi:hypothetical protein